MTKLIISVDRSAEERLAVRANNMTPTDKPFELTDLQKSIHFLRGVESRAQFALAGFYLLLASTPNASSKCEIEGWAGTIFQSYINHVSLNNISLACRKVFDHKPKGILSGAMFGKISQVTLKQHAKYWADRSGKPLDDALKALKFLNKFFNITSKHSSDLIKLNSTLGNRIGLIKQHADREAAHLSLEDYDVDILDVAHVVAVMALVAEIVRSFDRPGTPENFYDDLDHNSHLAAKKMFPELIDLRLFDAIQISNQSSSCWKWGEDDGLQMLLEKIPYATSFF